MENTPFCKVRFFRIIKRALRARKNFSQNNSHIKKRLQRHKAGSLFLYKENHAIAAWPCSPSQAGEPPALYKAENGVLPNGRTFLRGEAGRAGDFGGFRNGT